MESTLASSTPMNMQQKHSAIAETRKNRSWRQTLLRPMDGTCDSGNIDDEMLLTVWCDTDASEKGTHEDDIFCSS